MSLLQQIGQTVGAFLAAKRGAALGFAPTDATNKLPNSFLNSDVVIKDGTGRIPLSDLPLSIAVGGMTYQGEFDASTGTAPDTPSSSNRGWMWRATTAGVVAGLSFDIGDYIVSNGTGWDQIDNVEVVVYGTANEIVVSGNRQDGFTISLAGEFKTRLSDVEDAVANIGDAVANIGTTQQFSDALSAAFTAGV
jgi:hypothetical protein